MQPIVEANQKNKRYSIQYTQMMMGGGGRSTGGEGNSSHGMAGMPGYYYDQQSIDENISNHSNPDFVNHGGAAYGPPPP